MALRQLASKIFLPNLEKDLSRNLTKEVGTMDELMFMAGRVYSYQTKSVGSASVFGSTAIRQAPAGSASGGGSVPASASKLVRVDKPVTKTGLFLD